MTLYQFKLLDEMEQLEVFWDAVPVGTYSTPDGFSFECRQIEDFYVEYKKRDGVLIEMKTFRNPELLEPYFNNKKLQ